MSEVLLRSSIHPYDLSDQWETPPQNVVLFRSYCLIGAGHENRTRTSTLARSCTTTILVPHFLYDYTLFVDFFKPEVLVLAPSLSKCPREESNPYHKLRKLVSY